jgi:hypothetical protein
MIEFKTLAETDAWENRMDKIDDDDILSHTIELPKSPTVVVPPDDAPTG